MRNILLVLLCCVARMTCAQEVAFYDDRQVGSPIVNAFCQDADNFMWMGTRQGLRRFDGSGFVAYYHSGQDSTSLADNEVHSLCTDRGGRLWVGTANGLQRYVPEDDSFRLVQLQGEDLKGRILDIVRLRDGGLLCAVANVGIFRVDGVAMTAYPVLTESGIFHPSRSCLLFEDSRKQLWVGTDREGVVRMDLDTGKGKRYGLPLTGVKDIVEDGGGRVFVVSPQAVYLWDAQADELVPLPYAGKRRGVRFCSASLSADGHVMLGTFGQGVLWVKRGAAEIADTDVFNNVFMDASRAKVNALFEDNHRNLWAGCQYQGVLARLSRGASFAFWKSPSVTPAQINAIYCDNRNSVWCSMEETGIYQLGAGGKLLRHIPASGTVFSMYEDSRGTFWAGVEGWGLCTLDRESGKLELVCPVQGHFNIRGIVEDQHENLYVAVTGKGVLRYDLRTGEGRFLQGGPIRENNWVASVFCDSQGRVWFGHFGMVSCYDTRTGRFLDLPFSPEIKSSSFYAFAEGDDHAIWMATRGGLVCYDPSGGGYSVMTAAQGLPDDFVCGVVKDGKGDLWCSTMKGISHIDRETRKVTNYYAGNSLQENFYLEGRCTRGKDGIIYFGGGKGITSFNPGTMRPVGLDAAPVITDMYIYDKRVNMQTRSGGTPVVEEAVVHATDFHLAYSDNTFTFVVSTMDYRDAGSVFYEYRLKEFGEGWNRTQPGGNRIQYHHLAPGDYTLQVRACENGMHSPVKSVRVHVASPWYLTWIAKVCYTLLILGAAYLLFIAVRRKQREKIGEMKLQFFINIAHEIRSPLTLILAPLEKLMQKDNDAETGKQLSAIRYNADRILNLLNQLLDVRKIDKGQMRLHCVETDMKRFLTDLLEVFSEQAKQKGICLTADWAENLPSVWIDSRNFDKVLVNLLINALKYTPKGGSIGVHVQVGSDSGRPDARPEYMEISVSDTGKGLNEKELKRIFERFYQGDANRGSASLGFGIGLNLCQLLVKLHHGTISAENRKDTRGSRFVVRLPLGCRHLRKEEMEAETAETDVPAHGHIPAGMVVPTGEKAERHRTNYRVLVIDDDEVLRDFLQENLSAGYRVDTASDGEEGWRKVLSGLPDIVVSDVLMPGMDGIQLLKELKRNPNTNHIPVILLTSQVEFADRMEGLAQGADGYLGKPFRLEELDALISNLMANRLRLKGKFSGSQAQEGTVAPVELPNSDEALMDRIMKVVNGNLGNPKLNVEMLAKETGMSRTQLHRRIKDLTGMTAADFIRNLRLRQAARLLKTDKGLTVTEIAYATGFASQSHFSTLFKKQYGVTPTEYAEAETGPAEILWE